MDTKQFSVFLSGLHPLSPECSAFITQIVKEEIYIKNQVILSAGQVCNRLWFIQKGFAMQYSYKNIDKKPYRFWQEEQLMADMFSFFRRTLSESYIEVLEPCSLLSISYDQLQLLLRRFPETEVLIRLIIEEYHKHAEARVLTLLVLSAEERYRQLIKTSPFLFQKTSADNIAAYLGISKKTLNRMRRKDSLCNKEGC